MQYGKWVFKFDNDLVNHQVVNMLFEDDITVSFTMNPFGRNGRYIHIMGTGGEIHINLETKIKGDDPVFKLAEICDTLDYTINPAGSGPTPTQHRRERQYFCGKLRGSGDKWI